MVGVDAFHDMFSRLAEDANFEDAMIDGTITKVDCHGQGAKAFIAIGGNPIMDNRGPIARLLGVVAAL